MSTCPVCGRVHLIVWSQFWPYRRGARLFCSENCLIVYVTQQNFSKQKGAQKKMARLKNDGTPAKKPGRKPATVKKTETVINGSPEEVLPKVKLTGPIRIETPEASRVEVVETPEITEDDIRAVNEKIMKNKAVKPIYFEGYTVRCIEGVMGKFYYDTQFDRLDWTTPEGEEVSFSPAAWKRFATEELPKVMALLGVKV